MTALCGLEACPIGFSVITLYISLSIDFVQLFNSNGMNILGLTLSIVNWSLSL